MILIWAPYPDPDLAGNGWMRRIAAIDSLFASRERCYVFPARFLGACAGYLPQIQRVDERVSVFPIDLRFTGHRTKFLELLTGCEFLYAHTFHSPQFVLPYLKTGKVILDSHGIAPEEALLQGKPQAARFHADFEEVALRESAAVVIVTRAMERHYREKYPGLQTRFVLLPIHNELTTTPQLERPERAKPTVIYAGGTQPWQNIPEMMQVAAQLRDRFAFSFLSDDLVAMTLAASNAGVCGEVAIRYCPPERLAEEYAAADFGLVLRDDSAVNRVACPTKLFEYLAHGVIPVMKLRALGDFLELGGRCVDLNDFLSGRLPSAAEAERIRLGNSAAFEALCKLVKDGQQQVAALAHRDLRLDPRLHRSLFLSDYERTWLYPASARYEMEALGSNGVVRPQGMLEDLTGPDSVMRVEVPPDLRLLRLRIWPFLVEDLITRPAMAHLRLADGSAREGTMKGPCRTDAAGNWRFNHPDCFATLECSPDDDVRQVEIKLDVLAAGAEIPPTTALIDLSAPEVAAPDTPRVVDPGEMVAAHLGVRGLSSVLAQRLWVKMRQAVRPAVRERS